MRALVRWTLAVLVLAGASSAAWAVDDEPPLEIGQPAPEFTLKDQADQEQTLPGLLEKNNLALVFYRSADW